MDYNCVAIAKYISSSKEFSEWHLASGNGDYEYISIVVAARKQ